MLGHNRGKNDQLIILIIQTGAPQRSLARTAAPLAGSGGAEAGSCLVQLPGSVILNLTACIQSLKFDKVLALLLLSNSCMLFGKIKVTCVPWASSGLKNSIFMHDVCDTHQIDV